MERDKPTQNPRVRYDKTYPGHKEYLLYLYGIFKDLTGHPPRQVFFLFVFLFFSPPGFIHESLIIGQLKFIQQYLSSLYAILVLIIIMIYFIIMMKIINDIKYYRIILKNYLRQGH
jgi:hypothetical protein